MTSTETQTQDRVLKLPSKHARDWFDRLGSDYRAEIVEQTARTITLRLQDAALRDLISDALYYAEEMGPQETGEEDYRPAARRLLAALERLGIKYKHYRFTVTLTDES